MIMNNFYCVSLLILLNFMDFQSEGLKLVGPEASLLAVAGEDLVLPCFLQPNTNALDMTVEWYKLYVQDSLVHLYRDHEDKNENQAQSYRGRTSVLKNELQKGNASLKLSALQASDEGQYRCLVEDKSWSGEITVHVIVEVLGSHPVITMESYDNSGGINLVCLSSGWKPEPQVLWLDREGVTLPAEDTQIHNDTDRFSVERRITVYEYSDPSRFYCRLLHKHHMMQTEIIINSQVFGVRKWAVGISVPVCLIAVGLIAAAVIYYKKELQKESQKAASELQRARQNAASELQRARQNADFMKITLFAVDVTLDPDTAHPSLILTSGNKEVTCGSRRQEGLPDTPKRFDYACVLGKQSFSTGRFYYEVQVKGRSEWTLGVVNENIDRKEWISRSPKNGFWTFGLRNGNKYKANLEKPDELRLNKTLEKVGVFVDYKKGLVSFYNVDARSHIYSFTRQTFSKKLYPYFSPRYNESPEDVKPLIIISVAQLRYDLYSAPFLSFSDEIC